jgi:hypothetical protein
MRQSSMFGALAACVAFVGVSSVAHAQERPPIGLPTDLKDRAYTCAGQVMFAAYESSEDSAAWPHSPATMLEAGRLWVTDYAARSGQSVDAALAGDVGKLSENLKTLAKAWRAPLVNWCVRNPPG